MLGNQRGPNLNSLWFRGASDLSLWLPRWVAKSLELWGQNTGSLSLSPSLSPTAYTGFRGLSINRIFGTDKQIWILE